MKRTVCQGHVAKEQQGYFCLGSLSKIYNIWSKCHLDEHSHKKDLVEYFHVEQSSSSQNPGIKKN